MSSEPSTGATKEKANVGVPPPLVGLALIILGVALHLAFPAEIFSDWSIGLIIGVPLIGVGVALQAACVQTLRRAKTDMLFREPVSSMITHGLYWRSRNPMYVGILIWNAGLAFAVNTIWLLPLPVVLFLYLDFWVIVREERYLERAFGEQFDEYRSAVRRWL